MKLLMCFVFLMSEICAENKMPLNGQIEGSDLNTKCEIAKPIATVDPNLPKTVSDDKNKLDEAIEKFLQRHGPSNDTTEYMKKKTAMKNAVQRLIQKQLVPKSPMEVENKNTQVPQRNGFSRGPLKLEDKKKLKSNGFTRQQQLEKKSTLEDGASPQIQRQGLPNGPIKLEDKNKLKDDASQPLKKQGIFLGPLPLQDKVELEDKNKLKDDASLPLKKQGIFLGPLPLQDKVELDDVNKLKDDASQPLKKQGIFLGPLPMQDEVELDDENELQDAMPFLLQRQGKSNDSTEYMKKKSALEEALRSFLEKERPAKETSGNTKEKPAMKDKEAFDDTVFIKMQLLLQRVKCQGNSKNRNQKACPQLLKNTLDDESAMELNY